ncbi:MAG: hypothetical protein K0U98_02660 [Deltaproteobacteria bacterium]|nr:hypothetical protein [Deltaproteobacteria bacterium]
MPQGQENPTESCVPGCEPPLRNATRSGRLKILSSLLVLLPGLVVSGQSLPRDRLPPNEVTTAPTDLEKVLLAEGSTEHLPLRFARQIAPDLEVIFHEEPRLALAHFALQPLPFLPAPKLPSSPPGQAQGQGQRAPTLYLRASAYRETDQPLALTDLTVDSTDYLFHELLLAYLRLHVLDTGAPYAQLLRDRATELLPNVATAARLEGYLNGLAAFGGHTISVANQLERSARLHRQRGSDICRQADRPYSLFAAWEPMFLSGRYVARYYLPAAEGELLGKWVETKVALEPEDKRLFLQFVFDDFWLGQLQTDLMERYCSDQAAEDL